MKILFAASEVVPFAKTGGLADVTGALPLELEKLGHEVIIIMPRYGIITQKMKTAIQDLPVPVGDREEYCSVMQSTVGKGIKVYFVANDKYYKREGLYGTPQGNYPDNAERFIYFSRAVPEIAKALRFQPDIIHCNDWQTGLVPVYLKTLHKDDPFFQNTSTIFTYHNIAYQGSFWRHDLHLAGLGWDVFNPEGIEFYGDINLLKAGMVYSDIITTVSKTYAKETQMPEYGVKLDGVLASRAEKLHGILNGIDTDVWNPRTDKSIANQYSESTYTGAKAVNKKDLQECFELPVSNVPVIGMVSRLAYQKGFDILTEVFDDIIELGVQIAILGEGDEHYQLLLSKLAGQYKERFSLKLGFDDQLARKVYAGADIFLMPSRYEPCGLGQLIALRYGTVPLVRKTGGLADTITNYSPAKKTGNGFVFSEYSGKALIKAIKSALKVYENKKEWTELGKHGMSLDYSWSKSAAEYEKLYNKAIKLKKK